MSANADYRWLDERAYGVLIDQLRATVAPDAPFWTLEKYWQPSQSDREAMS